MRSCIELLKYHQLISWLHDFIPEVKTDIMSESTLRVWIRPILFVTLKSFVWWNVFNIYGIYIYFLFSKICFLFYQEFYTSSTYNYVTVSQITFFHLHFFVPYNSRNSLTIVFVFVLMGWLLLPNALFQIYCAPPNLGITRTWICRLKFSHRTIFFRLELL